MASTDNIAAQIVGLRSAVATNQRLRGEAEMQLALSKQRLKTIDDRLREIGINPENVDEELRDLESKFSVLAENLRKQLETEASAYNTIIEQTKAV